MATSSEFAQLPILTEKPHLVPTIALVGNPNAGKTSLFNRLTGLRAHTANFPGTTVEHRRGRIHVGEQSLELIDLPGLYSLDALTPDEQAAHAAIVGEIARHSRPDLLVLVLDATNLERNLYLASQVLELKQPTLIALNQIDAADQQGITIDLAALAAKLCAPVVAVSARTGQGIEQLTEKIGAVLATPTAPTFDSAGCACDACHGCSYAARYDWAKQVRLSSVQGADEPHSPFTDKLDRVLAHRYWGLGVFGVVMLLTFMLIFWAAQLPMDLIDGAFASLGEKVGGWLPAGDLRSLVADGVIGGVGGMLVFLPQICLLFLLIAMLEDSGYLARAAFVMDRLMRKVGLPGKAFVPMLSAHACAIPAIMSTRMIEDRRDRLATILIVPLMSCSARVPVYALVVALLFPHDPVRAALLFAGAYVLGIVAALGLGWLLKRTVLPGESTPLLIELPNYRVPSLRNALITTVDRAWVFIKNAGTTILVISLILWALATYPHTELSDLPAERQAAIAAAGDNADALLQQAQLERSFAGRIGQVVAPVFAPLGFDWKMSVGVVTSFAAREVIVSTLAVLYGVGEEGAENGSLYDSLRTATHSDGRLVFTPATCLSLLVFYVLAMQCLPTQAVTRRETGGWRWPIFQLVSMSVMAYVAALVVYQLAAVFGQS
jgi:ferrous iron transport protein B